MPGERLVYWDACVFVALLNKDPDRCQTLVTMLEQFEEDDSARVVTSTITKVEAAFTAAERANQVLDDSVLAEMDHLWEGSPTIYLVEFHDEIATMARELIRYAITQKWSLKPYDAIHLATAQWYQVHEFDTYDEPLDKYAPLVGFPIHRPQVLQDKLSNF